MFKVISKLTNKRPTKDVGTILVASTVTSSIKLSKDVAVGMGLANEDYLGIQQVELEDGSQPIVIFKGSNTKEGVVGSKLAENGSFLTCSAAAAWQDMGGTSTANRIFNVLGLGEGEEDLVLSFEGVNYYPIEFSHEEAKTPRKTKKSGSTASVTSTSTEVEEEEETEGSGF